MNFKLNWSISIFTVLLAACSSSVDNGGAVVPIVVETAVATEAAPPTTEIEPTQSAGEPVATAVATETEASDAAVTPATLDMIPSDTPIFANLRFATSPGGVPALAFPYGTSEVYAVWDYNGMAEGVAVQRGWNWAGEWIERTELWDMAAYGASGTVQDIYIFDYESESGLEAGSYDLTLFIAGEFAVAGSFAVLPQSSETDEASGMRAFVEGVNQLYLADADGTQSLLVEMTEIRDLVWLPGGRYLLFRDFDRSEQIANTRFGIETTMWLADVDTGELNLVGAEYHHPKVNENNRYVTFFSGSDYGDACALDRSLVVLALADGVVGNRYTPADFAGFSDDLYFLAPNGVKWISESAFEIDLISLCAMAEEWEDDIADDHGVYLFDLSTMTAEREIRDLPAPYRSGYRYSPRIMIMIWHGLLLRILVREPATC